MADPGFESVSRVTYMMHDFEACMRLVEVYRAPGFLFNKTYKLRATLKRTNSFPLGPMAQAFLCTQSLRPECVNCCELIQCLMASVFSRDTESGSDCQLFEED